MTETPPPAAPTAPPSDPYGHYRLTRIREAGGEETPRFEAILSHHGQPIAHVSNGGEGGGHRWSPVADDWHDLRAFWAFAEVWNTGNELAGIEDWDQLVNRLLTVAGLSRSRRTPFLLDAMDVWASGEYCTFPASVPRAQVLAALRSPVYAHRQPRVWSRELAAFVPVTDATA